VKWAQNKLRSELDAHKVGDFVFGSIWYSEDDFL
jgi:hypothetical protein